MSIADVTMMPMLAVSSLQLLQDWGPNLLRGLVHTLQIAFGAYALGLVLGVIGASAKLYGGPVAKDIAGLYTTLVRSIPELVLILLLYYGGTSLINDALAAYGRPPVDISGLAAGIVVLGIVQGAYHTEVLRGAILSLPPGQVEAARAYGMSPLQTMRRVTLPGMLPYALPGLSNLWLVVTKDTALLAVVGFGELVLETRQAASTNKAYFTFFMAAGVLYLALSLASTFILSRIERRTARGLPKVS
jgi:polar amino acid transport system permease protein